MAKALTGNAHSVAATPARGNAIAFACIPLVVLSVPFLDFPGIGAGAYVKPLTLPVVLLVLLLVFAQAGPAAPRFDRFNRLWVAIFAWAIAGDLVLPWIIAMPHEMKGQTLGGRILRDMLSLSVGMMVWFYFRLAIANGRQAVTSARWLIRSFWVLLPFLLVQEAVVLTDSAPAHALDSVLALARATQGDTYRKIFGLAPEGSMLADQLLSLYIPFALAAVLMRTSLFKRQLARVKVEIWVLVLALVALLFTQSRIGLISAAVLALSGWLLSMLARARKRRSWRTLILPVAVLLAAGAISTLGGSKVALFLDSFASVDDSIDSGVWSNVTRAGSMAAGLDMASAHPLGVGTGAFPFLFEQHVPDWALISPEIQALLGDDQTYLLIATGSDGGDVGTRLPDAKALPVRVLAELGIPGFVLLAAIWTGLARGCWRTYRDIALDRSVRTVAFGALLSLLTMLPLSFSINSYVWVHWILVAALAAAVATPKPLLAPSRWSRLKARNRKPTPK